MKTKTPTIGRLRRYGWLALLGFTIKGLATSSLIVAALLEGIGS